MRVFFLESWSLLSQKDGHVLCLSEYIGATKVNKGVKE